MEYLRDKHAHTGHWWAVDLLGQGKVSTHRKQPSVRA